MIQRQEGRLTLDDRFCWADAWAFEAMLDQAEIDWKKGGIKEVVGIMEKAIAIYKGPFLAGEMTQPWMVSMRERLRSKFLGQIEKIARYWHHENQWEKAIDCYLKGLEVDERAEEFYQGLMACCHRLGRKVDVLAVFQRYRNTLSAVPGFEPSLKWKDLTGKGKVSRLSSAKPVSQGTFQGFQNCWRHTGTFELPK